MRTYIALLFNPISSYSLISNPILNLMKANVVITLIQPDTKQKFFSGVMLHCFPQRPVTTFGPQWCAIGSNFKTFLRG